MSWTETRNFWQGWKGWRGGKLTWIKTYQTRLRKIKFFEGIWRRQTKSWKSETPSWILLTRFLHWHTPVCLFVNISHLIFIYSCNLFPGHHFFKGWAQRVEAENSKPRFAVVNPKFGKTGTSGTAGFAAQVNHLPRQFSNKFYVLFKITILRSCTFCQKISWNLTTMSDSPSCPVFMLGAHN